MRGWLCRAQSLGPGGPMTRALASIRALAYGPLARVHSQPGLVSQLPSTGTRPHGQLAPPHGAVCSSAGLTPGARGQAESRPLGPASPALPHRTGHTCSRHVRSVASETFCSARPSDAWAAGSPSRPAHGHLPEAELLLPRAGASRCPVHSRNRTAKPGPGPWTCP